MLSSGFWVKDENFGQQQDLLKEKFDECFTENAGLDLCSVLENAGGQQVKRFPSYEVIIYIEIDLITLPMKNLKRSRSLLPQCRMKTDAETSFFPWTPSVLLEPCCKPRVSKVWKRVTSETPWPVADMKRKTDKGIGSGLASNSILV